MSSWAYAVLLVARGLLTITGHVRDGPFMSRHVERVLGAEMSWGFALTLVVETRGSLLPTQRDCPQLSLLELLGLSHWLKADPFLAFFVLDGWFQEDAAALTNHDTTLTHRWLQPLELSQAPAQEMRPQWHFCLISGGDQPRSSSFSEHEQCVEQ